MDCLLKTCAVAPARASWTEMSSVEFGKRAKGAQSRMRVSERYRETLQVANKQEPEGKFCNAALVSTMKHGDRKKTGSNKQEVTNRSMEDMAQKTEVLQIHTARRIRRRRLMRRG
eukprot:7318096-Prymnesium_polylepis.1